jgi:hypothetical protein
VCQLKPSTCGHHYVARCSYPSKCAYITDVQKAKCVLQFEQNLPATLVQRRFHTNLDKKHLRENPLTSVTSRLVKQIVVVLRRRFSRRPSGETVERVHASFLRSPQKFTRWASRELGDVSHMTVWTVLRKRLSFRPYKFQLLQELKPNDRPYRRDFCTDMLNRLEDENVFGQNYFQWRC